ncbi:MULTISPECIES: bifunctional oligoribonuclease/PAP phosphatase NrnA [unclassified Oceanispirochaeta]|uniref:DHH family phosphoesterase n=1 Tax=unclassified Oceanispirochaeta TaxID=2635722 RepID=UPI000E09221A|nr:MULTISPECIES: DHH family phosphoesterase [unclassified Oceanispirochaeta]MBF9016365.1 DHH family phosphoesterase [Oceanispirochaeta sp. M2]NPD72827.1 DHH family phosphoesterase [Oceanispirochaeta sp. M1]RDG31671.1 DHH family phosphoesterase [Oceanispirochaeta sp. M1]
MTKLDELAALLKQAPDEVFIQPHNVPDPDAIAASFGLQYLLKVRGIDSVIVYENEVEKANSLKMLELFGIEIRPASSVETLGEEDWTVLVDVQKHNSNVTDLVTDEVACIDHHEINEKDGGYRFSDLRPEIGACSSIIADYFIENKIEIPRNVATALLYGIFMDTSDLSRGVSELDINMFYHIYRLSDISLITQLKGNQISKNDLNDYAKAFQSVEIYDEIGFLYLDNCNDSLLGAAGDIVLSIAGVNMVVAYSPRNEGIKFSLRSMDPRHSAEAMVKSILKDKGFGGGHKSMAGGFLLNSKLEENRSIHTFIRHRAISFLEN